MVSVSNPIGIEFGNHKIRLSKDILCKGFSRRESRNREAVSNAKNMNNEMKHTPTPWEVNSQGLVTSDEGEIIAQIYDNPDTGMQPIGEETSDFNAAFLIESVNQHAALLEFAEAVKIILANAEIRPDY